MIAFLILLVVFALFLQREMSGKTLDALSCSVRCESCLVEPEEPFTLVISVTNASRMPVFFLRGRCTVPRGTVLCPGSRGRIVELAHSAEYHFSCFLMSRRTFRHRVQLQLPRRGGYELGNVFLGAGDFLGLGEKEAPFPGSCQVVVLPRKIEGRRREVAGGLLGERTVRRWIHEDPILSAGFREYTGREPMKTINWNRSLQSGKLMVRQMDHTAEEKVTVLFCLEQNRWEDPEALFCLGRTVCEDLEAQGLAYAFCHNGALKTAMGRLPNLDAGLGRAHLNRILEGLGRGSLEWLDSPETLVRRNLLRDSDSACYLLLARELTPAISRAAAVLEGRGGCTVQVLLPEVSQ